MWSRGRRSPDLMGPPSARASLPDQPGTTGRRQAMRRGGRVVEGARLESVFTGNRNAGSNPALSAINFHEISARRAQRLRNGRADFQVKDRAGACNHSRAATRHP